MRFGIHTLDDFSWRGVRTLCRVDINEPLDKATGGLRNDARLRACAPTLRELAEAGARVTVLAHQGSDVEYAHYGSTRPHARVLAELVGRPVRFVDDVCGPAARAAVAALGDGELLLLDNVRFLAEEQTLFERALSLTHEEQARTLLVRTLAPLAERYVCDAFAAAHRDQPSLCGFERLLPSAMGRLFEREYGVLSELMDSPDRPCVFVLGGAKVADAFRMMERVLTTGAADTVLAGGLVGEILLAAAGRPIGGGSRDLIERRGYAEYIAASRPLLERFASRIVPPRDLAWVEDGVRREGAPEAVPDAATVVDIGADTARAYAAAVLNARTVFVNGPMGVFEEPVGAPGTRLVWKALAATEARTVLGGGDSLRAAAAFGVTEDMDHLCTGGGALIRFLSGEELPVVRALREGAHRFPAGEEEHGVAR